LNPGGILFLGTSETIGNMADCFETVHQKFKIYLLCLLLLFKSKGMRYALTHQSGLIIEQSTSDCKSCEFV